MVSEIQFRADSPNSLQAKPLHPRRPTGTPLISFPSLKTDHPLINTAFRIAIGDFVGNIQAWQGQRAASPVPCILAGLDYETPWTRDASFNSWFAGSLLVPAAAKNTLLSVLTEDQHGLRIGGEYWDCIIWVTGAWHHYLCTHDREFLATALMAGRNSLRYFEKTEFDPADGLFRGGACFQDGIAGYPDTFAASPQSSGIADWVKQYPDRKIKTGYGLPMKALSTNCLYYHAYQLLPRMAEALNAHADEEWQPKAQRLKAAINHHFWCEEKGIYRYLVDAHDPLDRQEGFGHSFAILFGIAEGSRLKSVLEHQVITPQGIPCVWPTYERYRNAEGTSFGRHSGTIWPQVSTAWVMATAAQGRRDLAWFELKSLAEKACRDNQFSELYHPLTGEIYGGLQERPPHHKATDTWDSCRRQTWCATGYIQMILTTLFGMQITPEGATFTPYLPQGVNQAELSGLHFGNAELTILVRKGEQGYSVMVNGVATNRFLFTA